MFFSSRAVAFLAVISTFVVTVTVVQASAADADGDVQQHGIRRLTIASDESIALQIQTAHANGGGIFGNNEKPRYKLHAEQSWGATSDFFVNVKEATPAITSATTTSTNDGPARPINDKHMATLLVADTDSADEKNTIAMIAVDKRTGNVNGIVNKGNGDNVNFFQQMGNKSEVVKAAQFVPPLWKCGASMEPPRHLLEETTHDHHHDHDHSHPHDEHNHGIDLTKIKNDLRNSNLRLGKRRDLQTTTGYKFQVDMYIEVDFDLCAKHGEACTNGVGPKTLNYINALFAGANTVFEKEIDTHLNVLHVTVNSNYASFTDTGAALTKMTATYGTGRTSFHFPNADLHHALLGKRLGGGIAWIGQLCSPTHGFGLSADLQGNFSQMNSAVVWDFNVFMHELGHNFGSDHTHGSGYSPRIDTCGLTNPCTAFPFPQKTATIMSYCHICPGNFANLAYTFGGRYNGSGDRRVSSSYTNSVGPGASTDPRRVNAVMYSHVASRPNNCLAVPITPPTGGGTCGGGNRGNGVCADGTCCSRYGWCGTTSDHCTGVPPPTPTPPVGGGTCGGGNRGNGVCADGTCQGSAHIHRYYSTRT